MLRFFILPLIALFPGNGLAQSLTVAGSIEGTVTEATGGAIASVRVTATNEDTGAKRAIETDEAGEFRFTILPIGNYSLRFEKAGFGPVSVESFLVSVGQTVVERIQMKPAEFVQKVEVKEQPEALDTTAPTPSLALGYERVEEAPAPGRNYLNFALVSPGLTSSSGSNGQLPGPTLGGALSDSGLVFQGMRGRDNSLNIDGVDNRDETTGGNRVSVGLEMVQEFRVSSVSVGAQYGGAAGGMVNVVTRSGTNIWHGDANFFVYQNQRFNARDPDVDSPQKPAHSIYNPEFSIMGPLRKDRTFIATLIEQEWEHEEEDADFPAIPLAAVNAALASPRYSRAAVKPVTRELIGSHLSATDFSVKLNHQSGIHVLMARYAYSRGKDTNDVQDVANFSSRSARGTSLATDHSFVAGWTAAPTSTFVNDLRLEIARRDVGLTPNARGAMLEIPGVVTLGQGYRLDGSRTEDHLEIVESAGAVAGRHQLNFGGDVDRVHLDARLANRFGGVFIFPTLQNFLAGQPDVFFQAFGNPQTAMTTIPVGLWLQDRWQPRAGLTLEGGLRYDRQWMPRGFAVSNRNLAPRLGLAWRPTANAPLVIRAAFGLFYGRFPLAFLNDAIQKDGQNGFEQYVTGAAAAQALAVSRGGSLLAPLPGVAASLYRPDPHFPSTYARKIAAGIEYRLGKDTTLTAEYNNVRGFHLPRTRNVNGGLPPLYQLEQTARSAYQGVSLYVNRRMSRELTFLVDYDAGKTWDDASDFDEEPLDPFNLRKDYSRSRQDQAQRFAASAVFELPAEEWHSAPARLRDILEKITVAPVLVAGSGRPINALDSTDTFRTGAYPISARPFGRPRNPFLSPGTLSMDLSVLKAFPIRHNRARLVVGAQAFNLLNHTNFLRVSPFYAAQGVKLDSYRGPVETLNGRQVQFYAVIEY